MEYDYEGAEITAAITKMTTHIFKATILLISCALIINYFLLKRESVQSIEEVSSSIDTSTMSLLAITEEQFATSDEFKNMAKLLREQAKLLDDSISRFKV